MSIADTAAATSVTDAPSASTCTPVTRADFDVSQPVTNVLQYTSVQGEIVSCRQSTDALYTSSPDVVCDEQLLLHFKAFTHRRK